MQSLAFAPPVVHPRFMPQPDAADPELALLGKALAALRREKGLSQPAASERFGTSPQNWAKYELGKAPTLYRPEVQRRLTAALGADIETLMLIRARLAGDPAPRPAGTVVWDARILRHGDHPAGLPIRHRLMAAWMMNDEGATFGHYHLQPDPRFPQAEQYLSELLDDSAEGLGIQRGDLAHIVTAADTSYWPRTGDVVEVERTRQDEERELTLRQVEILGPDVLLWLRTTRPGGREPLILPIDPTQAPNGPRILGQVLATTRRF